MGLRLFFIFLYALVQVFFRASFTDICTDKGINNTEKMKSLIFSFIYLLFIFIYILEFELTKRTKQREKRKLFLTLNNKEFSAEGTIKHVHVKKRSRKK